MIAERIEAADPFHSAIAELLARNPAPFFVQVGGYDGVSFDPLRPHIVASNLSGIIVEPVPGYYEKLKALYAGSERVRPINLAVAEENGQRTIWRFDPAAVESGLLPPHFGGISSFLMEDLLAETGVLGRSSPDANTTAILRTLVQAVPVECRTMTSLLEEQGVTQVDILQIDTEGYDYRVLQLFDFARFRPQIVHYEHQHLQGPDRIAAEALLRSHGYEISADAYDTLGVLRTSGARGRAEALRGLAGALQAEGRGGDALLILEHMAALQPDAATLLTLIRTLSAEGRNLDALKRLADLRTVSTELQPLLREIQAQSAPAMEKYNAHLQAGETDQAEPYAAALAELAPGNPAVLGAALSCNLALGRTEAAARYAQALLKIDPEYVPARQAMGDICAARGDFDGEIGHRLFLALSPKNAIHPLLRLRDIHDAASLILCRPLTDISRAQLSALLAAASVLQVPTEAGSEMEGWARHYAMLLQGIELGAIQGPTPPAKADTDMVYASATGAPLTADELAAHADGLGAQVTFFAAADAHYVELYARWYALSVLKYVDVPAMIVIHVIGEAANLGKIARSVGVEDPRLVFCADSFEAAKVVTRCFDSPPKGESAKPIAHYQCARFQRLGGLMQLLGRPTFVSDIDLLLQRGVADLLARCEGADVVLNENDISKASGSRITANLMLVKPTAPAFALLAFLRAYFDRVLAGQAVTRWIDQLGLLLGRHHLAARAPEAKIAYFDTASDINNVMYPSFQEHPFRFLSLYHGFDTSSLEDPRVLGESAPQAAPAKRSRKAK